MDKFKQQVKSAGIKYEISNPIGGNLSEEIAKCAHIVNKFSSEGSMIPASVIANARGVCVLSMFKAGFIVSGRGGSGLVLAKLANGRWSPPSAITTGGIGGGFQMGAEFSDLLMVLNTDEALLAFSRGGNVTLGGNLSVSAGPYGRNCEASLSREMSPIYCYSKSKGLFGGISIEGSVLIERKDTNSRYYCKSHITAHEILSGMSDIEAEMDANVLYHALDNMAVNLLSSFHKKPELELLGPAQLASGNRAF
jgi:lipid-binding SYLF domain-containing protein